MKTTLILLFLVLGLASAAPAQTLVYAGTYTKEQSKGIYVYRLDVSTGKLAPLGLAAEVDSPSFLAIHPSKRFLYAVSETNAGSVNAFSIDPQTGKLTFLNRVPSRGSGPAFVTVDKTGKSVLVANYGGGSVAAFPVQDDGLLREAVAFAQHTGSGVNAKGQQAPHAHSVNVSPDDRFAFVADLGLDQIKIYRFDAAASSLTPNDPPFASVAPGSGPRHFAFHPSGRYAYVINEMGNTVTAFSYDAAHGALKEIQTVTTLPAGFKGESYCAEVQVHPSGKFLYGSNRGHDSIAVFAIDSAKGTLTPIEHVSTGGKWPRNFGIDPSGSWLIAANQNSNNLVVFRIDAKSGRLTPTGQDLELRAPVCVKFVTAR